LRTDTQRYHLSPGLPFFARDDPFGKAGFPFVSAASASVSPVAGRRVLPNIARKPRRRLLRAAMHRFGIPPCTHLDVPRSDGLLFAL
jgi:hypothetical protein